MRISWRGPRLLTALLLVAATAGASTTATSLSISPGADPSALAKTLQSRNATEAAASAYWLGLKGTAAIPEIPLLIAALADNRPVKPSSYRADVPSTARSTPGEEAAGALARIGKPAVDPLIVALRASSSPVARRNAAIALGQIDTAAHNSTSAATPRAGADQRD